ncbi:MAG: prolipoprotein diacylglyceryl transferase [Chthoniobacteraceae bacterium]
MIAYYIDHFSPFIFEFGNGIGLRWYGTAYVAAFLLGFWMLRWFSRAGYSELAEDKVGDFIAATALWGVLLGGRLGYALFYDLPNILHDPMQFFRVWEGGMASHGGILGIAIFTYWYARKHKISWMGLGDNLVVAAPLGIFFGRCANFVNGELFGRPATVPWAMQFPKEIYSDSGLAQRAIEACSQIDPVLSTREAIVAASQTSEPVRAALADILTPRHPSQLYEAGMEGLLLFALLWLLRTKTRVAEGVTTGAFFILYAIVRIVGEQFREPDEGIAFTLGLTRGQFLSLFMILFGAAIVGISIRRNHPSVRPSPAATPVAGKQS